MQVHAQREVFRGSKDRRDLLCLRCMQVESEESRTSWKDKAFAECISSLCTKSVCFYHPFVCLEGNESTGGQFCTIVVSGKVGVPLLLQAHETQYEGSIMTGTVPFMGVDLESSLFVSMFLSCCCVFGHLSFYGHLFVVLFVDITAGSFG